MSGDRILRNVALSDLVYELHCRGIEPEKPLGMMLWLQFGETEMNPLPGATGKGGDSIYLMSGNANSDGLMLLVVQFITNLKHNDPFNAAKFAMQLATHALGVMLGTVGINPSQVVRPDPRLP